MSDPTVTSSPCWHFFCWHFLAEIRLGLPGGTGHGLDSLSEPQQRPSDSVIIVKKPLYNLDPKKSPRTSSRSSLANEIFIHKFAQIHAASTLHRDIDVSAIFKVHESGDRFISSVHRLIGFLENVEKDLCARPRSLLPITFKAAFLNLLGHRAALILQIPGRAT